MKTSIPPWLVIAIIVVLLLGIGLFMTTKVNEGTVGHVAPPRPQPNGAPPVASPGSVAPPPPGGSPVGR